MSTKEQKSYQTAVVDRKNSLPTSRTSILSKTLSSSSPASQKGGVDPMIEEILSTPLDFLHAIYKLQLQRDASFLGINRILIIIIRIRILLLTTIGLGRYSLKLFELQNVKD